MIVEDYEIINYIEAHQGEEMTGQILADYFYTSKGYMSLRTQQLEKEGKIKRAKTIFILDGVNLIEEVGRLRKEVEKLKGELIMSEDRCLARLQELTIENEIYLKALYDTKKELDKVLEGKVENLPAAKKAKELIEHVLAKE